MSEKLDEATLNQQVPITLLFKRKSIRIYPDGIKVALYHSDKLNKTIAIPFSDDDQFLNTVPTD